MSSVPSPSAPTPYGTLPPASPPSLRKPLSLPRLAELHARGEKITMLTAYDATFAAMADAPRWRCWTASKRTTCCSATGNAPRR